ncbi:MAG: serine/threonine protein kinase [Pontiellaceae bacterium]|nr:serine/threonine protein kinase [Pontiellaceae bacterium]MBN2785608.1 serine/threonine protein kinase [Pontiellaceae bacterium]
MLENDIPSEQAEEIFCDALEIESAPARAAFIQKACAENQVLLAEVNDLLAAHSAADALFSSANPVTVSVVEMADTLMDEMASETDINSVLPDDEVGKQIGPYHLLQKIGEGGGGNVYLAEQQVPVRRRVALKIIKLGMDTKSVVARFEAERQALAMMEHPNIAQVFDAGSTREGRPFFVMELVQGMRVTAYCDRLRLNIFQRLELFIQICHAIQHAHQKGIIHRDIKPSNVIITEVDGAAVPKVIDFGIAKAVGGDLLSENTALTAFEQFVGTPAYMSPEQADLAEMDIDVRSDIYSLGVLLYELLSGKTPFSQKELIRSGLDQMRRTIREEEPPRPSVRLSGLVPDDLAAIAENRSLTPQRLQALLNCDLDWVAMKALEKDRERRYRSADGLADDIQRVLNHEPVIARSPSRLYRFRKLVRRNKSVFLAGGLTAIVLLLGTTVSTWLLVKERLAQQRAVRAEQEKGVVQKEADLLRSSVEQLATASALFKQGDMEQADTILDGIERPQASPENAAIYRELGDWHALNGRWDKARERFEVLTHINEFEGAESTRDDIRYAAVLVEQGDLEEYDSFRESMIIRYAGSDSPKVAQRVLQHGLLAPANAELMRALGQFVRVNEQSYRESDPSKKDTFQRWQAFGMAMFNYRNGNDGQALYWCGEAAEDSKGLITRNLSVQLITACALYRSGQAEEAKDLLEKTRKTIDQKFSTDPDKSREWLGFWFDRACVRIYLNEADALIQ